MLKNASTHSNMRSMHGLSPTQLSSSVNQIINASLPLVWSIVRRFDKPQAYKIFVDSCCIICGDGNAGSIRELQMVSGLPAQFSIERLDKVDDELHVMGFSIIGGDHQLTNYRSTVRLTEKDDDPGKTVVVESYTVDIPTGISKEDTRYFINNIIAWNLKSLASVIDKMTRLAFSECKI